MQSIPEALVRHQVPAVYALQLISLMRERGCSVDQLLQSTGITESQLNAKDGQLSVLQFGALMVQAINIGGDPGLSFELALRASPTMHGFLGFGLMSCATLGDAVKLGERFVLARMPFMSLKCEIQGDEAVIEASEARSLGPMRGFAFELLLTELYVTCGALLDDTPELFELCSHAELRFEHAEPAYFQRYRHRLPRVRFGAPAYQICMPAAVLALPVRTANPVAAALAIEQCERELALLGPDPHLLERVRAVLTAHPGQYPDLLEVAGKLAMSASSLKRHLRAHGMSFAEMRDELRRRESLRLLRNPALSVERIASMIGYADPANFTRAFRKWTGKTPTRMRGAAATSIMPVANRSEMTSN